MTSKSLFSALSKFQIKRKLWLIVLCFVGWFFILPFITMLMADSMMQDFLSGSAGGALTSAQISRIANLIMTGNLTGEGLYGFVVALMAVVTALSAFMWNNDIKQVDFYRAVPVKESTRFIVTYLNGIIIYFVSFGINLLLVNLVALIFGVFVPKMLLITLITLFSNLVVFLAAYSITLIAELLTGNVIVGFLGACVLVLIEPAIHLIRFLYSQCFFKTYTYTDMDLGGYLSPLSAYIKAALTYINSSNGFGSPGVLGGFFKWILVLLIQAVIFTAIAYYIYKKRPPMTAGKTMLFEKTKPVIKSVIMIIASLLAGYILSDTGLSRPRAYGIAGIIFSCVIIQIVIELIYEKDIKKVLTGKISFVISLVISLTVFCIFAFDLIRYDNYIPDQDKIESLAVNPGTYINSSFIDGDYSTMYGESYLMEKMALTDEGSKGEVLDVIRRRIRLGESDEVYAEGRMTTLTVTYRLKSGAVKSREYSVPYSMSTDLWQKLYSDPDFRAAIHPMFSDGATLIYKEHVLPDEITAEAYEYYDYDSSYMMTDASPVKISGDPVYTVSYDNHTIAGKGVSHVSDSTEDETAFYEALSEDIRDRDNDVIKDEVPVGYLNFYVKVNKNRSAYPVTEQVYASDKRTMELIGSLGWDDEDVFTGIDREEINGIEINVTVNADKQYTYGDLFDDDECDYAGVDPDEICFYPGDYMGYYPLMIYPEDPLYEDILSNAFPSADYGEMDAFVTALTAEDIDLTLQPMSDSFRIKNGELAESIRSRAKEYPVLIYNDYLLRQMKAEDGNTIYDFDEYLETY